MHSDNKIQIKKASYILILYITILMIYLKGLNLTQSKPNLTLIFLSTTLFIYIHIYLDDVVLDILIKFIIQIINPVRFDNFIYESFLILL